MLITKGNVAQEMQAKKNSSTSQLIAEASEDEVKIELLIREKYSMSQELMLHRKKLCGTLEDGEWDTYTNYIEECISKAQEESNG